MITLKNDQSVKAYNKECTRNRSVFIKKIPFNIELYFSNESAFKYITV